MGILEIKREGCLDFDGGNRASVRYERSLIPSKRVLIQISIERLDEIVWIVIPSHSNRFQNLRQGLYRNSQFQ